MSDIDFRDETPDNDGTAGVDKSNNVMLVVNKQPKKRKFIEISEEEVKWNDFTMKTIQEECDLLP